MLINPLKRLKDNEAGFALLGALVVVALVGVTGITILMTASHEGEQVTDNLNYTKTLYSAESVLNGISYQLKTCSLWDSDICANITIPTLPVMPNAGEPTCTATLDSCIFSDLDHTVDVAVTATCDNEIRQLATTVYYTGCGGNANVPAAVSVRAGAPKANGQLQIDGRNHDRDCNLTNDASGTWAMSVRDSEAVFNFSGSADLGATSGGSDWGMDHSVTDRVEFGQTDLPNSADDVFHFDEGTLVGLAQEEGYYYDFTGGVDNDPFTVHSGVNYVEIPCGSVWQPNGIIMDNTDHNSILVVTSPCDDAVYKANQGADFSGILITDYLDTLHGTIAGAIVSVGSLSNGNNVGNGTGTVCYSYQVLQDAIQESGADKAILTRSFWGENHL